MEDFDLLIVRTHSSNCGWSFDCSPLGDLEVHHVDTLVYFEAPTPKAEALAHPAPGLFMIDENDHEMLERALRDSFAGYENHYSRNPQLSPEDLINGYVEWGISHLFAADAEVLALRSETQEIATFACIRTTGDIAEISLAATRSAEQGKGHYRELLYALVSRYAGRRLVISSQLSNYRVLAIWRGLGWTQFDSFHTYHVVRRDQR